MKKRLKQVWDFTNGLIASRSCQLGLCVGSMAFNLWLHNAAAVIGWASAGFWCYWYYAQQHKNQQAFFKEMLDAIEAEQQRQTTPRP